MKYVLAIALAIFFFQNNVLAQEKKNDVFDSTETVMEVPALSDFHTVIYQVWHTAWPEKNYTMLKELFPEIESGSKKIAEVQLAGIFRDKEKIWKENVEKLIDIVSEYKTAMEYNDNAELLDYAEQLHSQYEKLVRIVRPVLKELSDFHETLYPLYHYYLPENNVEKIHSAVKILQEKMLALNNATLSERWKKKEADFIESRKELSDAVQMLADMFPSNDTAEIAERIETMHKKYQDVEKVFE